MNVDSVVDFEGFMYLDVENPIVAWNTYRGVLLSQIYAQHSTTRPAAALSMTAAKMFMDRNWPRLRFEHELEHVRARDFVTCVSRLNCLYVFDEPESALAAADDESWGGHIDADYLTDVGGSAEQSTRVDANWISWMLKMYHHNDDAWRSGIEPYWLGEVCPYFGHPIWEMLMHGSVTVWGTALRQRAYEITKEYSPLAVSLLEQSRLAAHFGSALGHASALVVEENSKLIMKFFIDMKDAHNTAYTDKLTAYINENPGSVNLRDLAVGGGSFGIPNFAMYSYVFGS
jgi:hypothetical protein